ncbi:hypothetical protein [Phytoactinopolyspora limicola]|uniref:hypothetical protein n=1 Tax=Phytoactinopolyspora limicola TaxID=2715536 RepID=UPI001407A12F|nr:hypothetical protein [Phytoactinopolyspora limicola]
MTEAEALDRAEQHIRSAIDTVTPRPQPAQLPPLDIPCTDRSGQHNGLYQVDRVYWLAEVPRAENQQVFDDLHAYWTEQGYDIVRDVRDRELARVLTARTDGFTIRVLERDDGQLSINATSPCIRTSESPSNT